MNKAVIDMMANELNTVKNRAKEDDAIELDYIIKIFSKYSRKDLHLFRDCIEFMIIYSNK